MPIFFVPGFTQTAGAWSAVIAHLPDPIRAQGVALDVPLAESFDATTDALGDAGGAGCWVGYSMGGRLALNLALRRPELVDRLVLVSAGCGIEDPDQRAERRSSDDVLARLAERNGAEAFLDRWLSRDIFATLPQSARLHRFTDGALIAHQLRTLGAGTMTPVGGRLDEIEAPVLVITGTDDGKFDAIGERIAAGVQRGQHKRVFGTHGLIHENPEGLAALIADFVR